MAEPSTDLLTAETTSASGPSLPNSAKVRNKLLALKLNSVNGSKKQPKKVNTPDKILVLWWWAAFCQFRHCVFHFYIFVTMIEQKYLGGCSFSI